MRFHRSKTEHVSTNNSSAVVKSASTSVEDNDPSRG